MTNERTHGTTILFKEKEYLQNSRLSSVPLCSQSPCRSLTQVISDLGPVSVDRFFSSRNSHKWNHRVCSFSLTQHDAFESNPYCCHVSGICTTLARSQWHPTPVLLPGKSQGWRRLVGCSHWGRYKSDTIERLHFNALEKEMATQSSVLAWRIPGMGEPGGLLSMGSQRVGHN